MNRIEFKIPDLAELAKQYTLVDLHFHSAYSDGKNSIEEIADRVQKLGIGIAITDHNEIKGAVEIDGFKDILSIPGIEVTSREGTHILLYFYDIESLKRFYTIHVQPYMGPEVMSSISLTLEEIIQRARLYQTIIIFPHPYCSVYTGICNPSFSPGRQKQLFELADGVEVINSENLNRWNLRCALLGFNLGKMITGGSDGHDLYQVGRVVSYAECRKNRKAFLDAIKAKQNKVAGKEIDLFKKVKSNGLKLRTNLKNYPELVEKNFKYSYTVINSKSKILRDSIKRSIMRKRRRTETRFKVR